VGFDCIATTGSLSAHPRPLLPPGLCVPTASIALPVGTLQMLLLHA
jgi:hypothetical protein